MSRKGKVRVSGRNPGPAGHQERTPPSPEQMRSAAHRESGGFLLLDMALALEILLLPFAIIWPTFGNGSTSLQQSATALNIATLLRSDRTAASLLGTPTGTRIDLERRTLTSAQGRTIMTCLARIEKRTSEASLSRVCHCFDRSIEIPSDIALEVTTGAACLTSARNFVIVFSPDGSSCGGVIVLKKRGLSYAVRFNWLSGMIDVVHAPKT
jgi:general secretion pathway protein H